MVHLVHFVDQVLSILLQFGTFWQSILVHLIHFDDYFWPIWFIFFFISMIHFGPFGTFQWPSSLYFTSFCWFLDDFSTLHPFIFSICLILMINFASFESFSWFILVHLDHFGDQVLSIFLHFGTVWWLF